MTEHKMNDAETRAELIRLAKRGDNITTIPENAPQTPKPMIEEDDE